MGEDELKARIRELESALAEAIAWVTPDVSLLVKEYSGDADAADQCEKVRAKRAEFAKVLKGEWERTTR